MKRFWQTIGIAFAAAQFSLLVVLTDTACADKGEKIAAWENFIRYYPHDPQAEQTFRAIVRAASAPEHYDRNLKYADLVDIEKAQYNDQTGELILIGPRIHEWQGGYVAPLLVVDDFAMALRVLDAVGERELGVSIGTYNYGVEEGQIERDRSLGRENVEYIPRLTAGTHMGFVLFEADRWLKAVSHGRDNHTLEPFSVEIPGYRSQPERARAWVREEAAALGGESGPLSRPYGLNWFLPERPQVEWGGFSMSFLSYHMTIQYKAEVPDPEIAKFADHMTEYFDMYCREYPVFQELVRLHKLVQVAKWYKSMDFPDQEMDDYEPLKMPTPAYTRSMKSTIGRFNVPGGYIDTWLTGGVDFSPANVYVPSTAVPAPLQQRFGPPLAQSIQVSVPMAIASSPPRYGSYVGTAPVPNFIAPIVQARPSPTTYSWTVRIDGRILKAIAIPMTRKAIASRLSKPDVQATARATTAPRRAQPADNE